MDLETRRKISKTMKGKSNFEGKRHTHATKIQIGISQEGHRNAKDHKWVTDRETGQEHRVKGMLPRGMRWGRSASSMRESFAQFIKEKEVWEKPNPVAKSEKLSSAAKAKAKARAKAAGRPYPNMVDNIWAARKEDVNKEETAMIDEAKHKATPCGRCGTTHVPPKFGGTCPAVKEARDSTIDNLLKSVRDINELKNLRK